MLSHKFRQVCRRILRAAAPSGAERLFLQPAGMRTASRTEDRLPARFCCAVSSGGGEAHRLPQTHARGKRAQQPGERERSADEKPGSGSAFFGSAFSPLGRRRFLPPVYERSPGGRILCRHPGGADPPGTAGCPAGTGNFQSAFGSFVTGCRGLLCEAAPEKISLPRTRGQAGSSDFRRGRAVCFSPACTDIPFRGKPHDLGGCGSAVFERHPSFPFLQGGGAFFAAAEAETGKNRDAPRREFAGNLGADGGRHGKVPQESWRILGEIVQIAGAFFVAY